MDDYDKMEINQLGELVYNQLTSYGESSNLVPKITGMILSMDRSLIIELLQDKQKLQAMFNEAKQILSSS